MHGAVKFIGALIVRILPLRTSWTLEETVRIPPGQIGEFLNCQLLLTTFHYVAHIKSVQNDFFPQISFSMAGTVKSTKIDVTRTLNVIVRSFISIHHKINFTCIQNYFFYTINTFFNEQTLK